MIGNQTFNILLTSGGTSVKIDSVRAITNFSKGTLGKRLATQLLLDGYKVTHLHSINSENPFSFKVDLCNPHQDYATRLEELYTFSRKYMSKYKQETFDSFYEYEEKINSLMTNFKYDCVILCAAVSDFCVKETLGKIKSIEEKNCLELFKLPKIIKSIKQYQPDTKLVGFKMLVDASDKELEEAADKQYLECGTDLVVANNMPKGKNREVMFYLNKHTYCLGNKFSGDVKQVSCEIVRRVNNLLGKV